MPNAVCSGIVSTVVKQRPIIDLVRILAKLKPDPAERKVYLMFKFIAILFYSLMYRCNMVALEGHTRLKY